MKIAVAGPIERHIFSLDLSGQFPGGTRSGVSGFFTGKFVSFGNEFEIDRKIRACEIAVAGPIERHIFQP